MNAHYEIKTQKSSEPGFIVELDRNPYLAMPTYLLAGVMSKQTRIAKLVKYFTQAFTSEDEKYIGFRYNVSFIHKNAKDKKILTLKSSLKNRDIHIEGFKKFLIDNAETIDIIHSYVAQGLPTTEGENMTSIPSTNDTVARKIGDPILDSFELRGSGVERLTDDDIRQIKTLMMNGDHLNQILPQESNITDVEVKEVK